MQKPDSIKTQFRTIMILIGIFYFLMGFALFLAPGHFITTLNLVPDHLKILEPLPVTGSTFWTIMGSGLILTLAVLFIFSATYPAIKGYAWIIGMSHGFTSVAFFYGFMETRTSFAHFIGMVFDAVICVLVLWMSFRVTLEIRRERKPPLQATTEPEITPPSQEISPP